MGGAENLVLDLARYAKDSPEGNVDFHLVYMHGSLPERVGLFAGVLGEKLQFIPCSKGAVATLKFICSLRKYINANRIDYIHCHNNVDACWAYFASLFTGVENMTLSVHGFNLDFRFLSGKMNWFKRLEKSILRSFSVKYVSGVTRDFYKKKYGWKELEGDVVYNGVDWEKFSSPQLQGVKEEAWYRDGRPVFLMVGSFTPDIRFQDLICRTFGTIQGKLPFVFVFAGPKNVNAPSYYDNCVNMSREHGLLDKDVFFLGGRTDIPAVMYASDAYVYASRNDTFGISVVEAAGCGLPVACSDIPALREVLHGGEFGTLSDNTPGDFAAKMTRLSEMVAAGSEKDPFARFNSARAEHIRNLYSIENCFMSYYGKN